jgi:hypothetical protein
MAKQDKDESLEITCGVELRMVENGSKGEEFPCRYYATLKPNKKSLPPLDIELPVDLYQRLLDKAKRNGDATITAKFTRDTGRVTIDIYVK